MVRDYYVELLIFIWVIGKYYDIGVFVLDIVYFFCIVILNNMVIILGVCDVLMMEVIV